MKLIATRKTEGGMHCIFVLLLCWLLEDISALLCIYTNEKDHFEKGFWPTILTFDLYFGFGGLLIWVCLAS